MSQNGPLNLIITGVGGQGNVLISQIIGRALIDRGYQVVVGETFGLSQRGGSVQSHIRIFKEGVYGPLIPEGRAEIILGLEPLETMRILPLYGRPEVKVIANSRPIRPLNVLSGESRYPTEDELLASLKDLSAKVWWVNATATAQDVGAAIMANIVMLGCLIATELVPLNADEIEKSLTDTLPAAKLEKNLEAFRRGMELVD